MKKQTQVLSFLMALLMALTFTAAAAEALAVTATYNGAPLEGAAVPAKSEIVLAFSNNVTDESVRDTNIGRIKVKDAEGNVAASTVSVGDDKNTFIVTLGDLVKGSYTLELGKEIEAKNGLKLGTKVVIPFTVKGSGSGDGTGGGNKKLAVESVTLNGAPLEGATVKTGDTIVILFTNGMTEHGANSAKLISIVKDDGTSVSCEVSYPKDKNDDVAKKQFTVFVGLIDEGSYTLVLGKDIQANNGNTLGEDVKIAFTVAAEEPEPEPTFFARILTYLNNLFAPVYNLILRIIAFVRLKLAILWPKVA